MENSTVIRKATRDDMPAIALVYITARIEISMQL